MNKLSDLKYYQNYHKHTSMSHLYNKDSALTYKDYFNDIKNRFSDVPQIYSTVEHGWQSVYFRIYNDLEKFNKANNMNIKFIFGTEMYWVKDRFEKDNSNCHIVLLARNDNGRKALNKMIATAHKTGFYFKARTDLELLLSLPKDDVFVTTACIGFWNQYEDINKIVVQLNNHFNHFYLEVQANDTEWQHKVNRNIIKMSKKYNIPLIAGIDSHYLDEEKALDRKDLLASNGITYPEEEGNYMDVPTLDILIDRFQQQNILTDDEIYEAISNTNLILEFEDIILDRSLKVPIPKQYQHLSKEELDSELKRILSMEWQLQKNDINPNKFQSYKKEIQHDMSEIFKCNMSGYFLLTYHTMKNGIEKFGGQLTPSGRGSAVSMFLNKLLGFTKVDKVNSPVKMYSERFLTANKVIESKTLPDIDHNVSKREPFIEAQKELVGELGTYDLIALGTLKYKSAFKMYSRANNLDPQLANEVTKQITRYESDLKYAEDDEKDLIDIYEYVDKEKYGHLIEGCQQYMGITDTIKVHPCATTCYSGDVESDIGVILVSSETTKKRTLVSVIESETIDSYGLLKQDYLIVDSIGLMYDIYDEIGIEPLSVNQLLDTINNDNKVWDIYKQGYTMCVNQCEQPKSTQKAMKFQPNNIYELTQWISAIRPSFQTMYKTFENRKHFEYKIKVFDSLLQDDYCNSSFILMQEQLMLVLGFAGFEMNQTYEIIKAISKKKEYVIKGAKEKFLSNFAQAILDSKETNDIIIAKDMAHQVWKIIEDSSAYGFNASHAFCMAIDSVTLAYLKAYYPLEFYKVTLQRYTDKGNKDKVSKLKQELLLRGYKLKEIKFGDDNRTFTIDKDSNSINQTMSSIKGMQKLVPTILYELKDNVYSNFLELYTDLSQYRIDGKKINKASIEMLIKLSYFSKFGSISYLQDCVAYYDKFATSKTITKDKLSEYELQCIDGCYNKSTEKQFREIDNQKFIKNLLNRPYEEDSIVDLIKNEVQYLGYSNLKDPEVDSNIAIVSAIETNQWGTQFVKLYYINNGQTKTLKVDKKWAKDYELEENSVVKTILDKKEKNRKATEIELEENPKKKWYPSGEIEEYLKMWYKIL